MEEPIFLASTRRSGSTLLKRLIYSQPGVDYVDQPFEFWRFHRYRDRLPVPDGYRYTSVTDGEFSRILGFCRDLMEGTLRFRNQWNPLDRDYSFWVNRYVVKELNTKPILHRLDGSLEVSIVYLVRHPGAVALSVINRGWGDTAEVFLSDPDYVDEMLSKPQVRFCRLVMESWGRFERLILEWALENLRPLRLLQERSWLVLTYEELVERPRRMSRWLAKTLELPDPDRMVRRMGMPSATATVERHRQILTRDPETMAKGWFQTLSGKRRERMGRILRQLGIEAYQGDSPLPADFLTQFKGMKSA